MEKEREITGWVMYDWANSGFSSTVVSTFLGPYLAGLIGVLGGTILVFGYAVEAEAFYPYCVSISVMLQVIMLPILGTLADYTPLKKRLMMSFAYIGAISTMLLFFVTVDTIMLGGLLFIIANLAFGAAIVFYNAFLPDITGPDERDSFSSKGFAYGYIGGGSVLFVNLLMFQFMEDTGLAVRLSLASAGVWWLVFAYLFPQQRLVQRETVLKLPEGEKYFTYSIKAFWASLVEMKNKYPVTLFFLVGYLVYNDGIQTVIAVSSIFAVSDVGLSPGTLVQIVLMIQFIAAAGAILFNKLAERIGTRRTLIINLTIWCFTVTSAYAFVNEPWQFWILAVFLGLVLGSSQALSRSLFSQMIPKSRESVYFSLYEVSERGTAWIGPLLFATAVQLTGSSRSAILPLVAFFMFGIVMLYFTDVKRAIIEAGNELPAII